MRISEILSPAAVRSQAQVSSKKRLFHDLAEMAAQAYKLDPAATLDRVRPFVDLFLFDLKVMDDDRHRAATGVSNGPIQRNLRLLAEHGHRVIVRVPIELKRVGQDRVFADEILFLVRRFSEGFRVRAVIEDFQAY